jgi:hypothetical protein
MDDLREHHQRELKFQETLIMGLHKNLSKAEEERVKRSDDLQMVETLESKLREKQRALDLALGGESQYKEEILQLNQTLRLLESQLVEVFHSKCPYLTF